MPPVSMMSMLMMIRNVEGRSNLFTQGMGRFCHKTKNQSLDVIQVLKIICHHPGGFGQRSRNICHRSGQIWSICQTCMSKEMYLSHDQTSFFQAKVLKISQKEPDLWPNQNRDHADLASCHSCRYPYFYIPGLGIGPESTYEF